jgi:hypothetical protein
MPPDWQFYTAYRPPEKRPGESPRTYLTRLDKWSCKRVAALRKERDEDDKRPLRRRWKGFALVVEALDI